MLDLNQDKVTSNFNELLSKNKAQGDFLDNIKLSAKKGIYQRERSALKDVDVEKQSKVKSMLETGQLFYKKQVVEETGDVLDIL